MSIDWWTLGLQTVNFLVLVWILSRFLFRPVSAMLAQRQAAAHAALDEAEAARAEAQASRAREEEAEKALAADRAARIARAQADAEATRARLLDEARAQADATRATALAGLEAKRVEQSRALEAQAAELATEIAARLMARLPESARIAGFIDGLARAVAELPSETRARLAEATVTLRSPRALTDEEEAALQSALAGVLGHELRLVKVVQPDLLAGLELETPHAVVANTFRADLDRIRAELDAHG